MKPPSSEEIQREREEVRHAIVESLRLIVQSQLVLADLQVNQKRLEELLVALGEEDMEGKDGHRTQAASEEDSAT